MSAYEFAELQAYFSIEPYPETRADIRNAQLCATVANSAPFKRKNAKPVDTKDFIIDWWKRSRRTPAMNVETMKLHAKAWTVAHGGTVQEPKEKDE